MKLERIDTIMKKIGSMLMSITLIIILAFPVSASDLKGFELPSSIQSFSVSESSDSSATTFEDSASKKALRSFLSAAGSAVKKPDSIKTISTIKVRVDSKKVRTYKLGKSGKNYYLSRGSVYRKISLSVYESFVSGLGKDTKSTGTSTTGEGGMKVSAAGSSTYPGEVVVITISGITKDDPIATFESNIDYTFNPKFFRRNDGTQVALVPLSVYMGAGKYPVTIRCGSKSAQVILTNNNKEFVVQHLTVSASTTEQTILSQKANDEYEKFVAPLRGVADSKQYWDGRFILPVSDQKVTSPFGIKRYVNGGSTPTRHNALDLAVPLGTPVKATANGRVLYSGYLQLTGNTIIIEHGYGLKSWYYHMDSRSCKTGDMVEQGDIIGKVGSTGFSTGAHMHFGMSVNNVFINPYTAINTDLLAEVSGK